MILGDVTETHTVVEIDEETFEEIITVRIVLTSAYLISLSNEKFRCCLSEETELF
jgi:hypothetical protein